MLFADTKNAEALYCLKSSDSYKIKGSGSDDELYSLTISFEMCNGEYCNNDIEYYLRKRTFHFPIQKTYVDPESLKDEI